jgi:hypothetical protein
MKVRMGFLVFLLSLVDEGLMLRLFLHPGSPTKYLKNIWNPECPTRESSCIRIYIVDARLITLMEAFEETGL